MLIKPCDKETNYQLPVVILTKKGRLKKYRYYSNEYELFSAYRQLLAINGPIKPLYPIVYDEEVML